MYAYFIGEIEELEPTRLVVNVNGVGYECEISLNTYSDLDGKKQAKVYTQLIVRENEQTIYGFSLNEEKNVFNKLISVSGVGPNTARVILSSMRPQIVINTIENEDIGILKSVKGIGAKTAQRIILDLKGKFQGVVAISSSIKTPSNNNTIKDETFSALMILGYNKNQIEKVYNTLSDELKTSTKSEPVIKAILALLNKR